MTFPREFPLGVPVGTVLTSPTIESMDINISKSINGVDGDLINGHIEFTDVELTGTCSINTSGNIVTTGDVTCDNLNVNDVVVGTSLSVPSLVVTTVTCDTVDASISKCNRHEPRDIGTQSIDCSTGTVLALNFLQYDHWLITLSDSSSPQACAVLTTTATLVDTSGGFPEVRVRPCAEYSITFKAAAGQVGGIGLSPGIFPASFRGLSAADLLGPRTGQVTETDGDEDWIRIDLINTGTTTAPIYSCSVTMGSKLS